MDGQVGDGPVIEAGPPGRCPLPSAAVMAAENRVDAWADDVRCLVPEVLALRDRYVRDQDAYDAGEDEDLTELDLHMAWLRLFTAQHHLVWAAYQLERWIARLARERGTSPPASDPMLIHLRNALEHLDEAVFAEDGSIRPGKRSRSHHHLPDARLDIDTSHSERLFDVIDPKALERRAVAVKTTSDWLMEWAADGWAEQLRSDGQVPPDDAKGEAPNETGL